MSNLLSQLGIGASALGVQRTVTATASHNIENASTPGYARQRLELASLPASTFGPLGIGGGVEALGITQARDRFLDAQIPASLAGTSSFDASAAVATSVTTLDPDDEYGLPASLSNFYAALRNLSGRPGDPAMRQAAVLAADSLAQRIQGAARDISGARSAADVSLRGEVDHANHLAQQVASLNSEIRVARAGGAEPNDLISARRQAAEDLATLTGAEVFEADGDVGLRAGAVGLVMGDRAATFSVAGNGANRGHLDVVVGGIDGASSTVLDARQIGGRLGGILDGRDRILGGAESKLDQFAFDFAASLNAVHAAGVALDGSGGRNLLEVGTLQGAAGQLRVNAAIQADPSLLAVGTTAAPGDSSNLLAMISTESAPLASGVDPREGIANLIGDFGGAVAQVIRSRDAAKIVSDHLGGLRESTRGVSIEEEIVKMTQAQRVFEAVTKVIKTADEMLGSLLTLK